MKKLLIIGLLGSIVGTSCTKQQFADSYADPAKVSSTTVARQFSGFLNSNNDYVMYKYYPYFAVYQNTVIPWSQTSATLNTNGRYLPGAAAISAVWNNYYAFVAQYKDMLRVYNGLSAADQADQRIYKIIGTIYYYDYTSKAVDLWGDIPWSEAGLLGTNGGNYTASAAKYDDAATIYTTMLDSLKAFADELNTITVPASVSPTLKVQDYLNYGDLTKWARYCNSLRIKLLTKVNGVSAFQSRYSSEMSSILGSPSTYPVVSDYTQNISIKVFDPTSKVSNGSGTLTSSDFYTGLIGWGSADRAGKVMMDYMNDNTDPRLRALFEPGASANGVYRGLDPSLAQTVQTAIVDSGVIARYNRSTLTYNIYIPGMLINAAEVNFAIAEYYLKAGNDAAAQAAYEAGITQSVLYAYNIRTYSSDNTSGTLTPLGSSEIADYLASSGVDWSAAGSTSDKLTLIGTQKWINYNVLQPLEAWAEFRRLKAPALSFVQDAGIQKLPPTRWYYPTNESTYNSANYQAVSSKDNLSTKIFWDVN